MKIKTSRDCYLSVGTFGPTLPPELTKKPASFRVNSCPEISTTRVTLVLSLCTYYSTLHTYVSGSHYEILRWVRRMCSKASYVSRSAVRTYFFTLTFPSVVALQGSWNRFLCFHLAIGILLQKKRNKNEEFKYQHNILYDIVCGSMVARIQRVSLYNSILCKHPEKKCFFEK